MLEFTRDTLRDVDKALCDLKAAHHAACVRNLADEVSEVLDGRGVGLRKNAQSSGKNSAGSCRRSAR
jgi:hypothetical protein